MSNPVSQAEVEDVLASIRRLVSDHKRPAETDAVAEDTRAVNAASEETPDAGGVGDKLVLTPSLRVTPGTDELDQEVDGEASSAPVWLAPEMMETRAPAEGFAEAQAPYVLRDATQPHKETDTAEADPVSPHEASATEKTSPQATSQTTQPSDAMQEPPQVRFLSDTRTEAEQDVALHSQAAAAPGFEDKDRGPEPTEGADAVSTEPAVISASVDQTSSVSPASVFQDDSQIELGAKIAALEAVIARRKDQWEPDGVETDPYSGTAPPMIDWMPDEITDLPHFASTRSGPEPLEAANTLAPGTEGVSKSAPSIPASALADPISATDAIDEDVLQEIVGRIVREELQGPLGERITRNVRMLVRREIHRALVSRDFD